MMQLYKLSPLLPALILLGDLLLTVAIVLRVPYTEIDWEAYMSEVEGVHNGTYIYTELKGGTGPLVYPAGFVWLYLGLYHVTNRGLDIRLAQYIFVALYIVCIAIVFAVYRRSSLSPLLLILLCASRRVHSIFVLRLFNDCVAMTFLYGSVLLFLSDWWTLGCLLFSIATSIKMNILLFAPGLGVLLMKRFGWLGTIPRILLCAAWQLAVAVPFLRADAWAYTTRSFDLGRQFFHVWSVNLKFLPEEIFLRKELGLALLFANLVAVLAFAQCRWCAKEGGLVSVMTRLRGVTKRLSSRHIIWVLFSSNFIGIVFARSLHFQFYVWYFHTLPLLLWSARTSTVLRLFLLAAVELVWNIYPSNERSSLLLLACHLGILYYLFFRVDDSFLTDTEDHKKKTK